MLALAAMPAFAGGFSEDITKKVSVLGRLMFTFAAAVFASLLVGATLDRLDMPGLDMLLLWPIFAIAFTAFAVGGIAHSINIIDGFNGLASTYAILVLAAFAWVATQVGDPVVLAASLAMLGALLGFLVFNYPSGRIFMGDGGAYLLGLLAGRTLGAAGGAQSGCVSVVPHCAIGLPRRGNAVLDVSPQDSSRAKRRASRRHASPSVDLQAARARRRRSRESPWQAASQ